LPASGGSHSKHALGLDPRVRAGQIVEQDFELGVEQRLPALLQEAEQFRLVCQQFVEAAIQVVLLYEVEFLAQQIAHRTVFEPLPMQPPLTARIDQSIGDQGLQHVQPACPLARYRQSWRPELIQLKLIP